MTTLKKHSILEPSDLSAGEIMQVFKETEKLKRLTKKKVYPKLLANKSLGMIFQQTSTRTRVSFEVGMTQLGGHALFLNQNDLKLAIGETIADTARVLSRFVDGIVGRIFIHDDIKALAKYSSVPVINAMTNLHHPCQALADIFTVWERKKRLKGLKLSFTGDGDNNVTNSLLSICSILGINFSIASPNKYEISDSILSDSKQIAKKSGAEIFLTDNPSEAVLNADIVVTDTWTSPGKPDFEKRLKIFPKYQLNQKLLKLAKKDAMVLHCLPAHRGQEITDEVIDGPQSAVWDEAENRLHVQKALLSMMIK